MLFLFDIDGTLVRRMPPAHRLALCDAAEKIYGVTLATHYLGKTAGMTDSAIALRMLLDAGIDHETFAHQASAFYGAAADAYERHVPDDLRPYLTPHAAESLAWLREHDVTLGLVTGNIERIAWRKLAAAGLEEYFTLGAFGDEAVAREELPPLALTRAEQRYGHSFDPRNVYVIGDTPADIACGAASRLRTIAVATGPEHSLAELLACQPDFAFPDLSGLYDLPIFGEPSGESRKV